jgi:methionine aminotransferase
VSAGDEVIIIEPCYDSYLPAIETMGATAIPVPTFPPNFSIDWQKLKDCITLKTKMIIVNSPGNPSTKILRKSDYEMLAELLDGTDIILLSDEVYEHLIYDDNLHTSPLSIEGLKDRTLSIFSFGKTFHNTGWKLGYCIAVEALMKEFRKVHQFNVFCANSFVQEGFSNYMNQGCPWQELPSFYQEKRDKVVTSLNQSKYNLLHSEGSFFILADYSEVSNKSDMEFINDMIIHQKIALIPLSVFYKDYPKGLNYVRICFAKTDELLDQGIRALLVKT